MLVYWPTVFAVYVITAGFSFTTAWQLYKLSAKEIDENEIDDALLATIISYNCNINQILKSSDVKDTFAENAIIPFRQKDNGRPYKQINIKNVKIIYERVIELMQKKQENHIESLDYEQNEKSKHREKIKLLIEKFENYYNAKKWILIALWLSIINLIISTMPIIISLILSIFPISLDDISISTFELFNQIFALIFFLYVISFTVWIFIKYSKYKKFIGV